MTGGAGMDEITGRQFGTRQGNYFIDTPPCAAGCRACSIEALTDADQEHLRLHGWDGSTPPHSRLGETIPGWAI